MKGVLLLNRDFRLEDQSALVKALEEADELAILWIYDPRAEGIEWWMKNESHALSARLTAFVHFNGLLETIGHQASLILGSFHEALTWVRAQYPFETIYYNRCYDRVGAALQAAAQNSGAILKPCDDIMIFGPTEVLKKDGSPYQMFTPYYRQWLERFHRVPVLTERQSVKLRAKSVVLPGEDCSGIRAHASLAGGYSTMAQKWRSFLEDGMMTYSENRDFPGLKGTSGMSVYLNTGMISPRRFVADLTGYPGHEPVLRQYVWREFYQQLAGHYPKILESAMRQEYALVAWEENPRYFEAWRSGKTGVPVVDAAMRCLNAEGVMHNRLRMVAASYLVKDLHVNWQLGERYFFQMLADSEPVLNNGGWQWCASTGTDAQPYFRVFNPWQQSLKYDPEAVFMKQWLPEVRNAPAALFHKPGGLSAYGYPEVIVDHASAVRMTKALYQESRQLYARNAR